MAMVDVTSRMSQVMFCPNAREKKGAGTIEWALMVHYKTYFIRQIKLEQRSHKAILPAVCTTLQRHRLS